MHHLPDERDIEKAKNLWKERHLKKKIAKCMDYSTWLDMMQAREEQELSVRHLTPTIKV